MSDNFEFDDNDDVLLNAFCTPPNKNTSPEKCFSGENQEILSVKRPKIDESSIPIIQFSHIFDKTTKDKSRPRKNVSVPNAAKRIFPGPAGILSDENQTDICSQDSSSFFQDGPWKEMSKDFKISNAYLYYKFNIAWIKREATINKFVNQKVPFLAGILFSLEVSEGHNQKSINITLKDMTGTIQGTILQNLYEEYASHLILGSVLVLIQFGVLSCTCDKCDNHHLTITPKNLSTIYSGKKKIIIKRVDPEDVLNEYCRKKKELELGIGISWNRNLTWHKISNSPIIPSAFSNRCTYGTNRNVGFQNSLASRNVLSNTVNKTINNSENILQKIGDTSPTILLPKVRAVNKSISETTVVGETNNLTNLDLSRSSPSQKKLFTFRKANSIHELSSTPQSGCSRITVSGSSLSGQNTALYREQNNSITTKQTLTDNKNGDSLTIVKSELSVKVDREEDEKIWQDLLEDVDISSLFDDDF